MRNKLRVGLIGAGGIMRKAHLNPGWLAVPDCQLVAVCDNHRENAVKLAEDFNIPRVFEDHRELLELDEIDVVDIATPNAFHAPFTIDALKAGKHVLCEKPLATTTAAIRSIREAADETGLLVMTAQQQRYTPSAVAIRRFLEGQPLGHVYHSRIHAVRRNWMPPAAGFIDLSLSGGGPCMDIGVHALDMGLWLMGFPKPTRVTGRTMLNFAKDYDIPGGWGEWDHDRVETEDFASGFIHFENGATMILEACWLQHQHELEDFSARLFGREGSIEWPSGRYSSAVNRALFDSVVSPATGLEKPYTEEILDFADALRTGRPSPVPPSQSIQVTAILEALYESHRLNKEITLTSIPASETTEHTAVRVGNAEGREIEV